MKETGKYPLLQNQTASVHSVYIERVAMRCLRVAGSAFPAGGLCPGCGLHDEEMPWEP